MDARLDIPNPAIVGIDLSLTATGIAFADGTTTTISPRTQGAQRLIDIRDAIGIALDVADGAPDLVLIEGYAFARTNQAHQVGEIGGIVRVRLYEECLEYPDMGWAIVPPAKLKKFATGTGTATKTAMIVAARERLGFAGLDDNQADALWLRALGLALYGALPQRLPQTHLDALSGIEIMRRPASLAVVR